MVLQSEQLLATIVEKMSVWLNGLNTIWGALFAYHGLCKGRPLINWVISLENWVSQFLDHSPREVPSLFCRQVKCVF